MLFSARYGDWKQLFGGTRGFVLQADALGPTADTTGRWRDRLPFSAGPYRVAAWDTDDAVLSINESYWVDDRQPAIDQIRLVRVSVDDLSDPKAFDVLVRDGTGGGEGVPDGFDPRPVPTTEVMGIWFDRRTPLLQPVGNRQVLAALTDRAELADLVASADTVNCLGWLPGVGPWCEAAAHPLPEHDAELAAFALTTAGWVPDAGGILRRGEEVFAVPVAHDPTVPGSTAVAEALAESLQAAGIGVDSIEIPRSAWLATRTAGQQTGIGVYPLDVGISAQVERLYGCAGGPDSSVLAWCEPEVVAAAQSLDSSPSLEPQLQLVGRIGEIAAADVAWLPLAQVMTMSYVRTDIVTAAAPSILGPLAHLFRFDVDR